MLVNTPQMMLAKYVFEPKEINRKRVRYAVRRFFIYREFVLFVYV